MMNLTNDSDLIRSINFISQQFNLYLSLIIFLFGLVGNILNCLVLSQHTLRTNPCALLFLVSSFIDFLSILIGLPFRILSTWNLDLTTTISWICKLRAFIVFSTRTMATWLITLATIDRWLLSCIDIHRRQMSTVKNVQHSILILLILSSISFIHMFYCYESNLYDTPLQCYGKNKVCRLATDMIYTLITIIIPLILMIIFGLMTISNVHHVHNRAQPGGSTTMNSHTNSKTKDFKFKKIDHHLLRMLLIQVLLLIVLCVPQVIEKFHSTFKPFGSGSELDDVIRHFLYNMTLLLAFIASGMPFYIYTLSGKTVFRKTFIDLIRNIVHKILSLCN